MYPVIIEAFEEFILVNLMVRSECCMAFIARVCGRDLYTGSRPHPSAINAMQQSVYGPLTGLLYI